MSVIMSCSFHTSLAECACACTENSLTTHFEENGFIVVNQKDPTEVKVIIVNQKDPTEVKVIVVNKKDPTEV